MASLSIYLKTEQVNAEGQSMIYFQISHKGKKIKFSTGKKAAKKHWDAKQRIIKNAKFAYDDNLQLKEWRAQIEAYLHESGHDFNLEVAKVKIENILKGNKGPTEKTFLGYLDDFMRESQTTRGFRTIQKYASMGRLLDEFSIYMRWPLTYAGMTNEFGARFLEFLVRDKNQLNNTAEKYMSCLRTYLTWTEDRGHKVNPDYRKFRGKKHDVEKLFLTEDELMKLYDLPLEKEGYRIVRDLFCFGCFTGLRYSDIMAVSIANIREDAIWIRQQKTSDEVMIPLNPYSRAILERYDYKLPRFSNVKCNTYIKAICKIAGFDSLEKKVQFRGVERINIERPKHELITFHDSRKTFTILMLYKKISRDTVKSITGHKTDKAFNAYVKIVEDEKRKGMKDAWG